MVVFMIMEPVGIKKFYGNIDPAHRRFRLQKSSTKPVPRTLHALPGGTEIKRKRCSSGKRQRKVPDEPEILTLSSDDEEKQEKKPDMESQILGNGSAFGLHAEAKAIEAAVATAEGPDSYEGVKKSSEVVEGGGMLEQAADGSLAVPYVLIACRTVRIGTYKAKPSDKVGISSQGIEIKLPLPSNGHDVIINIPASDISRVLVSFCRTMPVLFIYLKPNGSAKVREILHMTDSKSSYYFNPDSSDDTHKRITLLPEKLTEDHKMGIKKIFKGKIMAEINNSLANEILVRSSPCESLRPRLLPGAEIKTIMIYPPPPAKGGISINTEDYACLGEDQFLNDVIIDFYLKYLLLSVLSEEDRERTHVFSSFFYKRLTSRPKMKGRKHPIEDDPKLSPAEKRHARVKGWTKNVNLFSKDFIIIPINENSHWFLAIVCFPGQDGCLRMSDNTPIEITKPPSASASAAAVAAAAAAAASTNAKLKVKNNIISIGSTTITPVKAPPPATITLDHNGEDGSDRDEAEGDEEEMEESGSEDEEPGSTGEEVCNNSKDGELKGEASQGSQTGVAVTADTAPPTKRAKSCVREGIKQPCILIFDSLVGAPRYRVAATLREYLSIEYKVKENKPKGFTKDTIKGMLPKVPQQTNFTDCGLYLLQYVEMFFKDPIRDYHPPIKQLQNWFQEEVVTRKREDIVHLIQNLLQEQSIDISSLNLPPLTFSHNKAKEQAEDAEARARLAEAEAEAQAEDREIVTRQLLRLHAGPYKGFKVEPMETTEEGASSHTDTVLQAADSVTDPSCQPTDSVTDPSCQPTDSVEDVSCENMDITNCESVTNDLGQSESTVRPSLVDYSESSNESNSDNSVVKRTQSEAESEDSVGRKKRKAD